MYVLIFLLIIVFPGTQLAVEIRILHATVWDSEQRTLLR